jgi:hypothetical protein
LLLRFAAVADDRRVPGANEVEQARDAFLALFRWLNATVPFRLALRLWITVAVVGAAIVVSAGLNSHTCDAARAASDPARPAAPGGAAFCRVTADA